MPRASPMVPALLRGRRQARETRHVDARARAGRWRRRRATSRPGQFAMLYAFGVGEVPISVSAIGDAGAARAHHPRGRRRSPRRSVRVEPRRRSACAGRSATAGRWRRPRAATWWWSPAASASRRCGPRLPPARAPRALRRGRRALRRALARGAALPASSSAGAGASTSRSTSTVDSAPTRLARARRRGHHADPARRLRPAHAVAMICGPEVMMRFTVAALRERGVPPSASTCRWSAA